MQQTLSPISPTVLSNMLGHVAESLLALYLSDKQSTLVGTFYFILQFSFFSTVGLR